LKPDRLFRVLTLVAALGIAWLATGRWNAPEKDLRPEAAPADIVLAEAFEARRSNLLVQGRGTVIRILPDDNDGSRHQRFILQLDSGHTLLVAHNIDLAPRIPDLKVGDVVEFSGEYEWNPQGGVIHWTHHDPQGRHPAGWLRYQGKTYQ
jgi:hypothetical protein